MHEILRALVKVDFDEPRTKQEPLIILISKGLIRFFIEL